MQDLWNRYIENDHAKVVAEADKALFAASAPDMLHVSGLSLLSLGRIQEALPRLRAALTLFPSASWFANTAIATLNSGATQESAAFAKAGLVLYPGDAVLNFAYGNALMAANDCDAALAFFEKALAIDPSMADARLNLANCLRRLNRFAEALAAYDGLLAMEPGNIPALVNKVSALMETGRDGEAEAILLDLGKTGLPEVDFMRSMIRLAEGDYEQGWALYRKRWSCAFAATDAAQFRAPLANSLTDIAGKRVLVSHEQGFGDSLQFVRYVPLLARFGEMVGCRVALLAPKPLARLFANLDKVGEVVTSRDDAGQIDLEVPMLDLPYLFGTKLDTIPATLPYLRAPAELLDKRRLPFAKDDTRLKVGLCWAGQMRSNPDLAAVDRRRSMRLADFHDLDMDGVALVSLQLGEPARQVEEVPAGMEIMTPLDPSFDFADTAAVIEQLDLVITVDTAVAHLAGALGKPVWVLSRYDACWRWLKGRDDSPWYPKVMRLFRQTVPGDWSGPLAEVRAALAERAAR